MGPLPPLVPALPALPPLAPELPPAPPETAEWPPHATTSPSRLTVTPHLGPRRDVLKVMHEIEAHYVPPCLRRKRHRRLAYGGSRISAKSYPLLPTQSEFR